MIPVLYLSFAHSAADEILLLFQAKTEKDEESRGFWRAARQSLGQPAVACCNLRADNFAIVLTDDKSGMYEVLG